MDLYKMNLQGPFKYQFLGRKMLNSIPPQLAVNIEQKQENQGSKLVCHFCSNRKADYFQCVNCSISFCSVCVEVLTTDKNKLNTLNMANKKGKWKCFICTNECPCSICKENTIKKVGSENEKSCKVCKRKSNVFEAVNLIRLINQNQKVKKVIMEYKVFSPLFQHNNNDQINLCHKCQSKLQSIYEANSKEVLLLNQNIIEEYPVELALNNKHKEEDETVSLKCVEPIDVLLSSSNKDIDQQMSSENNTSNQQMKQHSFQVDNTKNISYSTNYVNNDNTLAYSPKGIVYQPIIPLIQIIPQYLPPLPPFPPLLLNQLQIQAMNQFNDNSQYEMQKQLLVILYKSISFFFNNCLQSKVNILSNINLLLNYANSEGNEYKTNQSFQSEYNSFHFYLNEMSEEINQQLNLLNSSQEQLNQLTLPFDMDKEIEKNNTEQTIQQGITKSNTDNNCININESTGINQAKPSLVESKNRSFTDSSKSLVNDKFDNQNEANSVSTKNNNRLPNNSNKNIRNKRRKVR